MMGDTQDLVFSYCLVYRGGCQNMLNTTEHLTHLLERTKLDPEFKPELLFEALLQQISQTEAVLENAGFESLAVPHLSPEYVGVYTLNLEDRPVSTTGSVIFGTNYQGKEVAFKSLQPIDLQGAAFTENTNPIYALHDKVVRAFCLWGELLKARLANIHSYNAHLGLAGMRFMEEGKIELVPLDEAVALFDQGDIQIVMVMEKLPTENNIQRLLEDLAQDRRQGIESNLKTARLKSLMSQFADQVHMSATEVDVQTAEKNNSLPSLKLLFARTTGLLKNHPSEYPEIMSAKEKLNSANRIFQWFFSHEETQYWLEELKLECQNVVGDSKVVNGVVTKDERVVLLDPVVLGLNPGILDNDYYMLAPWSSTHLLQAFSYQTVAPVGLGLDDIYAHMVEVAESHTNREGRWEQANGWFELYFAVLTAYKMFIEVAVNVDQYLKRAVAEGENNDYLIRIIEEYPVRALDLLEQAKHTFFSDRH